jgi:hypothetical protein
MSTAAPPPCRHEWRDRDYVCTLCGAVKRGAPPQWVWENSSVKPGQWAVLLALWTFADGTPDSRPVWPGNTALRARARGIAASTLRDHLRELKKLGWIRLRDTHRREFELAWLDPFALSERTLPDESPAPRRKPGPTENRRTPDGKPSDPRRKSGADPTETRPHTYHDVVSDLPVTVEEAREREPQPPLTPGPYPAPPPKLTQTPHRHPGEASRDAQREDQRRRRAQADELPSPPPITSRPTSRVTGKPSAAQRSAQAQLERERAEVRAELTDQEAVPDCPWSDRVRARSESAHYLLDQTATSTHKSSYSVLLRQARANYGDEGVLEALRKWELADYASRPPAKALWHSSWRTWVEQALGIKPPERTKPGQLPMSGALRIVKRAQP